MGRDVRQRTTVVVGLLNGLRDPLNISPQEAYVSKGGNVWEKDKINASCGKIMQIGSVSRKYSKY